MFCGRTSQCRFARQNNLTRDARSALSPRAMSGCLMRDARSAQRAVPAPRMPATHATQTDRQTDRERERGERERETERVRTRRRRASESESARSSSAQQHERASVRDSCEQLLERAPRRGVLTTKLAVRRAAVAQTCNRLFMSPGHRCGAPISARRAAAARRDLASVFG